MFLYLIGNAPLSMNNMIGRRFFNDSTNTSVVSNLGTPLVTERDAKIMSFTDSTATGDSYPTYAGADPMKEEESAMSSIALSEYLLRSGVQRKILEEEAEMRKLMRSRDSRLGTPQTCGSSSNDRIETPPLRRGNSYTQIASYEEKISIFKERSAKSSGLLPKIK